MDVDRLTWTEVAGIAATLADAVAADGIPDVIIGIARGGLVPAVLLAHLLGLRDVRALEIAHTESDAVNAAKIDLPVLRNSMSLGHLAGGNALVVDDIAGSGDTLVAAREQVVLGGAASVRTAVCLLNLANWPACREVAGDRAGEQEPTYVGRRTSRWVVFPWERS
ncbi:MULTISPECIES: phosphoribosyltransferase [Pseudofrankia]|uniref:phosphoribosyltransferase n=1 Tax=Pseudofrankia TaxID=2994363 RepID=UPI000234C52C|nr:MULTISPECIES: phosphoribosyltransferase family protein [Pseudofrankia]